ncbi:MAG: High-affinity nickel transporter [Verrucomicrobia bacterium]|nr:High-affinity nickel transporter [Verrucomicrobiota bacterium]MBI3869759.1 High-affinity nickel transporter [Verrucomicrobiota bacterium]
MILAFLTGCLAGTLHVVSGPDHLAALAPLAASGRERPWKAGLKWGFGHSAGVALVGLILLLSKERLHIDLFSAWAEVLVGVALCGVGVWGLRRALSRQLHLHVHAHGDRQHIHFHTHSPETRHRANDPAAHQHGHAALAVGTLHGFAGSSHFFGVLPALALPGVAAGAIYLLGYSAGTIAAMSLYSEGIHRLTTAALRFGLRPYRIALSLLATVSLGTGLFWIVDSLR